MKAFAPLSSRGRDPRCGSGPSGDRVSDQPTFHVKHRALPLTARHVWPLSTGWRRFLSDAECLVKRPERLNSRGMSVTVHTDGELVKEADLAQKDRPGRAPVATDDAYFRIPKNGRVIVHWAEITSALARSAPPAHVSRETSR